MQNSKKKKLFYEQDKRRYANKSEFRLFPKEAFDFVTEKEWMPTMASLIKDPTSKIFTKLSREQRKHHGVLMYAHETVRIKGMMNPLKYRSYLRVAGGRRNG